MERELASAGDADALGIFIGGRACIEASGN